MVTTLNHVAYVVVDAATGPSHAPDHRTAYVSYGPPRTVGTGTFPRHEQIALGELRAILQAVAALRKERPLLDLIVLGTDSLNAKAWVQNQYAKCAEATPLLAELERLLGATRLYLVYIDTDENGADAPSRGLELDEAKVRRSRARLAQGWDEASHLWVVGGRAAGGNEQRRREREVELPN